MWETFAARWALALFLCISSILAASPAFAVSFEEKQLFTVTGVEVDARAGDAATARTKAISQAQVKAFAILAERLAGPEAAAALADLSPQDVGRLMASLSVDSEKTAPGRYIGKLNVGFLPEKVKALFATRGIALKSARAEPILILPVWQGPGEAPIAWDDNPWRRALLRNDLAAAPVPLRLPLGDLDDSAAVPDPATADPAAFAPLLARYGAKAAVVLIATQDADGIRIKAIAPPELPGLAFAKVYPVSEQGLAQASGEALGAIAQNWRAPVAPQPPAAPGGVPAPVPFTPAGSNGILDAAMLFQPVEWGSLRQIIARTDGVKAVDLIRVTPDGGLVRITYAGAVPELQTALSSRGLKLVDLGTGWILQRQ